MKFQSVYDNMTEAEMKVCRYVNELGLWWTYEQPVFVVDDKQRPRVWTPDFYIPELGLYIEVVGNPFNGNYGFREMVYNINRIPIVFINTQKDNWKATLIDCIKAIHQQRWESIKRMQGSAW